MFASIQAELRQICLTILTGVGCAWSLIARGGKAAVNVIDNEGDTPVLKTLLRTLHRPALPGTKKFFRKRPVVDEIRLIRYSWR